MPEPTLTDVLVSVARIEGKMDAFAKADTDAASLLKEHAGRIDKLERIAYVALGVALASGAPQLVSIFTN